MSHPSLEPVRPVLHTNLSASIRRVLAGSEILHCVVRTLTRLRDVPALLAADPTAAVLMDAATCSAADRRVLGAMLHTYPTLRIAAWLPDDRMTSIASATRLYNAGVHTVVSASTPERWQALRRFLDPSPSTGGVGGGGARSLAAALSAAVATEPALVRRAIICATVAGPYRNAEALADAMHVHGQTLISTFYRRELPSPTQLLQRLRVLAVRRCAADADDALSLAELGVACAGFTSTPALTRSIRAAFGQTIGQWLATHTLRDVEAWVLAPWEARAIAPTLPRFARAA